MFTHILIPTDGSEVAAKAVSAGIEFAKESGATITAYCAAQAMHLRQGHIGRIDDQLRNDIEQHAREFADQNVAQVADAAKAAGVACDTLVTKTDTPYEGIIDAARKNHCDVIFMASNGRSGLSEMILGSVTHKVLTHSKVPVLVVR